MSSETLELKEAAFAGVAASAKPAAAPPAEADDESRWPVAKSVAFATAVVTFLLGMLDLVDRQVMAALFPYLKEEFALNDKQLGLLMSMVNLFMSILVVPSAYFIDRWSRKKMIFLMSAIWSLATGACAFVTSYGQMLFARMLCGCGEAGYQPAGQSLLAACFPRKLRGTAVAIITSGMALGAPVGLLLGAFIAEKWGWRHALGLVAVPGLILSVCALFLKDFTVGHEVGKAGETKKGPRVSYLVVMKELLTKPTILCVLMGAIFLRMYNGVAMSWLPSYFKRIAEMPMTSASALASLVVFTNAVSMFYGGPLLDWLRRKNQNLAPVWITCAMFYCGILNFFAFRFCVPGSALQMIILLASCLGFGTIFSAGTFLLVDIASSDHRGTAVSLMILAQNLFGYTLGPVFTGAMSDKFGLATAMWVVSTVMIVGGFLYGLTIYTYPRDRKKVVNVELSFNQ